MAPLKRRRAAPHASAFAMCCCVALSLAAVCAASARSGVREAGAFVTFNDVSGPATAPGGVSLSSSRRRLLNANACAAKQGCTTCNKTSAAAASSISAATSSKSRRCCSVCTAPAWALGADGCRCGCAPGYGRYKKKKQQQVAAPGRRLAQADSEEEVSAAHSGWSSRCLACPANTVSPGGDAKAVCTACPAGTQPNTAHSACVPPPPPSLGCAWPASGGASFRIDSVFAANDSWADMPAWPTTAPSTASAASLAYEDLPELSPRGVCFGGACESPLSGGVGAASSVNNASSGPTPARVGVSHGWDGLGSAQMNNDHTPTDMAVASSGAHVVNAINQLITIYAVDPATGLPAGGPLKIVNLANFFELVQPDYYVSSFSDPGVFFDRDAKRFVVSMVGFDRAFEALEHFSRVYLGVSATADPTGVWHLYSIEAPLAACDPQLYTLPDYPQASYDNHAIAVTVVNFCLELPSLDAISNTAFAMLLDKRALYAGAEDVTAAAYDLNAGSNRTTFWMALPARPATAADVTASADGGIVLAAQRYQNATALDVLALLNTSLIAAYSSGASDDSPTLCAPPGLIDKGVPRYAFAFRAVQQPPFANNGSASQDLDSSNYGKMYGASLTRGALFLTNKASGGAECVPGGDASKCNNGLYWGVFNVTSQAPAVFSPALINGAASIIWNDDYSVVYSTVQAMPSLDAVIAYSISGPGDLPDGSGPAYLGLGTTTLTRSNGTAALSWAQGDIAWRRVGASPLNATKGGKTNPVTGGTYYRLGDYAASDLVPAANGAPDRVYVAAEYSQAPDINQGGGAWIDVLQGDLDQ